jgi:hypothetical protein
MAENCTPVAGDLITLAGSTVLCGSPARIA